MTAERGQRLDRRFVEQYSAQYRKRNPDQAAEDRLLRDLGPRVRKRGWYTLAELKQVNRWKLPTERNRKYLHLNSQSEVQAVTLDALGAADPRLQLRRMQTLHGVGPGVASALLMVAQPDRHTVIDFRAVGALEDLGRQGKLGFDLPWPIAAEGSRRIPEYGIYLDTCKQLAVDLGVSLRSLDRALWEWQREATGESRSGVQSRSQPGGRSPNSNLYINRDVWKRIKSGRLCRYRCIHILASDTYVVQSADFFDLPFEKDRWLRLEAQFQELLAEEAPEVRGREYNSIDEAIEAHDREFGEA